MNSDDLRINRGYIYNQVSDLFEDITVTNMAIDRCGTLYLVDKVQINNKQNKGQTNNEQLDNKHNQGQNLYRFHANEKVLEKTGNTDKTFSLALKTISAIGVDNDTIYIADCVSRAPDDQTEKDSARLIALTKNDLQIRWILSTGPDGIPLNKIHSVQCDNRGKVYILEGSEKRILYMNTGDICYPSFRQLNLKDNRTSKLEDDNFTPEDDNFKPENLTIDIDGVLYVLFVDNRSGKINYFLKIRSIKEEQHEKIELKIDDFSPSGIAVDNSRQIFIGGSDTKRDRLAVHKYSNDATRAWIPLTIYIPPNETPEKACQKLISDPKGNLYFINDDHRLIFLDSKESNFQDSKGYFEGTYISKPIDSQISNTYWHRLLLEGEFEKGTQVDFQYFVSNNKDEGPQKPQSNKWLNCISKGSAIQGSNKRDALFIDNIKGRYLWFKITLSGNENLSPAVKSVTVFFPRISYLDYLPDIYKEDFVSKRLQEDSVSKRLLERFLAIFESIFYEIDFTIDHISRYFDTCGAPPEFLSWLASWLDVSIDEDWPEDKKRPFIRNAISLYKKRGTRECLEESIELFTGKKPFVVERFQAFKGCTGSFSQPCNKEKEVSFPSQENIFFPPDNLKVKECPENADNRDEIKEELLIDKLYGTERFSFCVLLTDPDLDATSQSRIMRIIEEQKPAHTSFELKVLKPLFYLDMHTYLEINTVVTEPKFVVEKTSMLGRDTVLYDEEKAGQIERHSRVGIDILLS